MATEFGLKLIKAKPLLDFTKGLLEASNPGVKKAAIEVLTTMRRQIGPDVRGMLSDVKPALLATIDEAFGKMAQEPAGAAAPAPTRQVKVTFSDSMSKSLANPWHFAALKTGSGQGGFVTTRDLLTCVHFGCVQGGVEDACADADEGGLVNLASLVAPHLKAMGDANWKERQAGITAVDEVCKSSILDHEPKIECRGIAAVGGELQTLNTKR